MTLRSHTAEEILDAYTRGETICVLDTGTHGQDDILIGSLEDCRQDVIDTEGRDVFDEDGWNLSEIGEGDEPLKSIIEDALEEVCVVRYIYNPQTHEYVSDGRVYETREQADQSA